MKRFLQRLGIVKDVFELMIVQGDSQFETISANDPKYHGRIKYLDNKNNFIRDIIARRENDPEMVVDPFTKSIPRNMFFVHVKSLGLCRL